MKSCIAYPNLKAEMARKGITIQEIATKLNRRRETMSEKLSLKSNLLLHEAFEIQRAFFPDLTLEYLFRKKD
ncbi:MAG: XRE family transcriptional regulator [Oscillospiraceae bacterium]